MDYTVREFNPREWHELEKALKSKDLYVRAEGLGHLPPIFDIGDEVGFFYGPSVNDNAVGIIVEENELNVTIRSITGEVYVVSPFLIFALR